MITDNLIGYIEKTPDNFNRAVFQSLLNNYITNIKNYYTESNITKINNYLYSIDYSTIDYQAGEEYCHKYLAGAGACSSVVSNGYYGRNYDWYYDNAVSFQVNVSATDSRHASMGVATVSRLEKDLVESGDWNDFYTVLPNLTLDGINDAGVCCNINVVPSGDYGYTTGTNRGKRNLNAFSLVRFVLDNADSVEDAITKLSERNIWVPHGKNFNYELHLMIADGTKSCVIEFINNEMKVIDGAAAMTNFYLYNVQFNEDGSVYAPATQDSTHNAITTNHVTPFGSGLERYNIINSSIDSITDDSDMLELMKSLNYTNTYTETPDSTTWYTEMVGVRGLTVADSMESYAPVFQEAWKLFQNRDRSKKDTWQTVHTSVYDLANKTMKLLNQEDNTVYEFELN